MARKIAYWISTVIVAVMLLFALSYLTGNPQVVSALAKRDTRSTSGSSLGLQSRWRRSSCCCPGLPC
jgi:hypothetical protein